MKSRRDAFGKIFDHVGKRGVHCPPLAGAGWSNILNYRLGVDWMRHLGYSVALAYPLTDMIKNFFINFDPVHFSVRCCYKTVSDRCINEIIFLIWFYLLLFSKLILVFVKITQAMELAHQITNVSCQFKNQE